MCCEAAEGGWELSKLSDPSESALIGATRSTLEAIPLALPLRAFCIVSLGPHGNLTLGRPIRSPSDRAAVGLKLEYNSPTSSCWATKSTREAFPLVLPLLAVSTGSLALLWHSFSSSDSGSESIFEPEV